jgi:ATP-binding cassette subfamily F protein 3
VKVLSGGERNRLALAKLMLQPFNVLIMDEPTNHLDIKSKNVLKAALNKFEGTLILVSHDRDFLQGLADNVFEFKDYKIKEFLGNIDFYLEQRNLQNLREAEKRTVNTQQPKENNKQDYQDQKKIKSLNNKLSNVEAKISDLEKEVKQMDEELLLNYDEVAKNPKYFDKYHLKKNQLADLMTEWEQLQVEIDQLTS